MMATKDRTIAGHARRWRRLPRALSLVMPS
jgi:hypothetical protein